MKASGSYGTGGKKRNLWLLAAVFLVLLFIWGQSCLPVKDSSRESSWLLEQLVNPILHFVGLGDISHTLLRKLAHVSEFAVLSALLACFWRGRPVQTLLSGFVAATLDESLQLLSDRGARVSDIWIDFIGVAVGTAFGWLVWRLVQRSAARKQAR